MGVISQNTRNIREVGQLSYEDRFANVSETDGENDNSKMIELDGVKYAHKSWFFIFHSTIPGNRCKKS